MLIAQHAVNSTLQTQKPYLPSSTLLCASTAAAHLAGTVQALQAFFWWAA